MNLALPLALFGGSVGGGEMLLIGLIALLMFGAKSLPKMARSLGRSVEQFKRAARDVQQEIINAEESQHTPAVPPPPDYPQLAAPETTPAEHLAEVGAETGPESGYDGPPPGVEAPPESQADAAPASTTDVSAAVIETAPASEPAPGDASAPAAEPPPAEPAAGESAPPAGEDKTG